MRVVVSGAGLNRLEHDIRPPMRRVITIPVFVDGAEFVVYVTESAFMPNGVSDVKFVAAARELATRMEQNP